MPAERSDLPLREALPPLLAARGISLRAVAAKAGTTDPHLSRVLRGVDYKTASGDLAGRIALALRLPQDYFPEYREALVVSKIKNDNRLRDRLYDELTKPGGHRSPRR